MIQIKEFKVIFVDDKPLIVDEKGLVVFSHSQIGWVFNDGPPHDHNRPFMFKGVSGYLEDLHMDNFIEGMVSSNGKVFLLLDDGSVLLYDGMVIMDLYSDFENRLKIYLRFRLWKKILDPMVLIGICLENLDVLFCIRFLRYTRKTGCMRRLFIQATRGSLVIV